ncbi:MAG: hypothetical protein IT374_16195 [Polyangiaceae bacterium]|nr:hypothetical protein [Polyangiaceae bacterium]
MTLSLPSLPRPAGLALSLSLLSLSACASLRSVSVTQVPADRSRPISAESHDWTVFGIAGDNDYADEVPKQLMAQCQGGKVTGVLTKSESKLWVFVSRRRVTAQAFCVADAGAAAHVPAPSAAPSGAR